MTEEDPLLAHIADGVDAIAALHAQGEHQVSRHQRLIETLSVIASAPSAVYVMIGSCAAWVLINWLAATRGDAFDPPPFIYLQGGLCFGALLTGMIVAVAQRRQAKISTRRAQLDLQVNLLAEKKLTKLIALVEELRRDTPSVKNRRDPEAEALSRTANPEMVVQALEAQLDKER